MTRLKAELPDLKKHMNMAYDWDMVEGAVEYNVDLARKNSPRQGNDPSRVPRVETWKDDVAERARRIWLWWRERSRAKLALPTFVEAVRLVVLVLLGLGLGLGLRLQLRLRLRLHDKVRERQLPRLRLRLGLGFRRLVVPEEHGAAHGAAHLLLCSQKEGV